MDSVALLMCSIPRSSTLPSATDRSCTSREQRLRWLACIVESSDDVIVSKNLDGIITSWNRGAERLFGYTAEETIGQPITIVIPEERQSEEHEILTRIRRGERVMAVTEALFRFWHGDTGLNEQLIGLKYPATAGQFGIFRWGILVTPSVAVRKENSEPIAAGGLDDPAKPLSGAGIGRHVSHLPLIQRLAFFGSRE